jgi:hypothetical protein
MATTGGKEPAQKQVPVSITGTYLVTDEVTNRKGLFWRQDHDHLASLEAGVHLDLGDLVGIAFETIQ